jgi:hypothetical protein
VHGETEPGLERTEALGARRLHRIARVTRTFGQVVTREFANRANERDPGESIRLHFIFGQAVGKNGRARSGAEHGDVPVQWRGRRGLLAALILFHRHNRQATDRSERRVGHDAAIRRRRGEPDPDAHISGLVVADHLHSCE